MPIQPVIWQAPRPSGALMGMASTAQGRGLVAALSASSEGAWEAECIIPPEYGAAVAPAMQISIVSPQTNASPHRLQLEYGVGATNGWYQPTLAVATVNDFAPAGSAFFRKDWTVPLPAGSLIPNGTLRVRVTRLASHTNDTGATVTWLAAAGLQFTASA